MINSAVLLTIYSVADALPQFPFNFDLNNYIQDNFETSDNFDQQFDYDLDYTGLNHEYVDKIKHCFSGSGLQKAINLCDDDACKSPEMQLFLEEALGPINAIDYLDETEKFCEIIKNLKVTSSSALARNMFSSNYYLNTVDEVLNPIRGYGCWCSLESGFTEGVGQPVLDNGLDTACRQVNRSYKCLKRDQAESGCNFDLAFYHTPINMAMISSMESRSFREICEDMNSIIYENASQLIVDLGYSTEFYECAMNLCTIEASFMSWLLSSAQSPTGGFHMQFIHEKYGGNFDPNTCDLSRIPGDNQEDPDIKCCGEYPVRTEYPAWKKSCCRNNVNGIFTIRTKDQCVIDETVII